MINNYFKTSETVEKQKDNGADEFMDLSSSEEDEDINEDVDEHIN